MPGCSFTGSALALFERAGEPKKLIWYETGHMDLFALELIRALTKEVVAELREVGYLGSELGCDRPSDPRKGMAFGSKLQRVEPSEGGLFHQAACLH